MTKRYLKALCIKLLVKKFIVFYFSGKAKSKDNWSLEGKLMGMLKVVVFICLMYAITYAGCPY